MKATRLGFKKRRPKLKMTPELTVQANWEAKTLGENPRESSATLREMKNKDLILSVAKRAQELKARGYPEEWIERDLEKLTSGL